jgi:hypothetical protein
MNSKPADVVIKMMDLLGKIYFLYMRVADAPLFVFSPTVFNVADRATPSAYPLTRAAAA